jgi:hypothetical protein
MVLTAKKYRIEDSIEAVPVPHSIEKSPQLRNKRAPNALVTPNQNGMEVITPVEITRVQE